MNSLMTEVLTNSLMMDLGIDELVDAGGRSR